MPVPAPASITHSIRRYYEQNTPLFLSLGSSPHTLTIHRAVWSHGVMDKDTALNETNQRILTEILNLAGVTARSQHRLADLGCGVGGTLFYLLTRLELPTQAFGFTISPTQVRLAVSHMRRLDLLHSCLFAEVDFQSVPLATGMDLVYSVEAFVHAVDPGGYFSEAARLLRPGGRLVLCDDFRANTSPSQSGIRLNPSISTGEGWLQAYQEGWHVPNLITLPEATGLAAQHGLSLIKQKCLTSDLRIRALPEALARLVLALGRWLPVRHAILPSLLGSLALQQCLQLGLIDYHFVVFEKQTPSR